MDGLFPVAILQLQITFLHKAISDTILVAIAHMLKLKTLYSYHFSERPKKTKSIGSALTYT